ncbi:MAG: preprotein translocase subunit SecA [Candidatus Omnitrophica bacterium]|nr:preprotein translocase subunit SecA [Candidatus Omnitrophota bacterium]
MFDFFIRGFVVKGTQKFIDKFEPKVSAHIPKDIPLPSASTIKRMVAIASRINAREKDLEALSDEQLRAKTDAFKVRYKEATKEKQEALEAINKKYHEATSSDEREEISLKVDREEDEFKKVKKAVLVEILPEAFAVVREASKRVLGLRHYDIQLIGGIVLHEGKITEMATGEGKTLTSTLPVYLNALTGEGVHVVTVNDYLANRDRHWMGPIYEFLGLTVGVILHDMDPSQRQGEYGSDVTYGTNNEFGFDYLRDNMVNFKEDMAQRKHHFAIVDEVDSVLVDEARTPLIISGPAEMSTDKYYKANEIARGLKGRRLTEGEIIEAKFKDITVEQLSEGYDYIADEKARSISMTEPGEEKTARQFGVETLHDMDTIEYRHHILQALKAKEFFKNDVDYVLRDGQVVIVDEFTGRMMPGRRWSDGLHQAVEAKEQIKIERENQTLATVTFQNYFRMYEKLAGMTGTAHTEATEFEQIYNLETIVMPTNRPLQRMNYTDCIYKTFKEKFAAVVEEIVECHGRGQPVLAGTISIEKSELLSALLERRGIPHKVLNAKYHEMEAQIIAQAGRKGAVTIATNMAGRGTDIVLGGNPEFLAKSLVDQKAEEGDDKDALTKKFLQQFEEQCKREHDEVVEAGGLHVLATERHESRRIDNQLRGRSGRQGDPGSSRFYVSLEDDLMRLFGSDRIMMIMDKLGMEEGQVIEVPLVARSLEVAQKRVEGHNYEIRKQLLEYDNVMNKQREAIYSLRRNVLESKNVKDLILEAIDDVVYGVVEQYLFSASTESQEIVWDMDGLEVYLRAKFGFDLFSSRKTLDGMAKERIHEFLLDELLKIYEQKEKEITTEQLRYIERILLLNIIDSKWKDHLYAMDQLKEAVGLRSYAQRDPLMEYKKEGFHMFQMMYVSINQEVAETIFKVQPVERRQRRSIFESVPQELVHNEFSSLSGPAAGMGGQPPIPGQGGERPSAPKPIKKDGPKVGRNDPCPCGSGKKYKKCCGG